MRCLEELEAVRDNINGHLSTVGQDPNAEDTNHHRGEIRAWVDRVEKYARDMKGKTQDAWLQKVDGWRKALEELTPK